MRQRGFRFCAVSASALFLLTGCGDTDDEEQPSVDSVAAEAPDSAGTAPVEAVERIDTDTLRITLTTCDARPEIASWSIDAEAREATVLVTIAREGGLGDCLDSVEQEFSETGAWTLIDERDGGRYEIEPLD